MSISYILCMWWWCSSAAFRCSSGSFSSGNISSKREESVADIGLGEHRSWEPLPLGIGCQLDRVRAGSSCSALRLQLILLESSQIWPSLHHHRYSYWLASLESLRFRNLITNKKKDQNQSAVSVKFILYNLHLFH